MSLSIKKIGHSCLVIEKNGTKIMIDPGDWSMGCVEESGISALFITHKHPDHLYIPHIQALLTTNPDLTIWTNADVGAELEKNGITWNKFEDGDQRDFGGITVEGCGTTHAQIHPEIPDISNTGLLIDETLYHPGDKFHIPEKSVKILALPLISPWNTVAQSIEFARTIKPEIVFPIHDGMLIAGAKRFQGIPKAFLEKSGIEYTIIADGETRDFK